MVMENVFIKKGEIMSKRKNKGFRNLRDIKNVKKKENKVEVKIEKKVTIEDVTLNVVKQKDISTPTVHEGDVEVTVSPTLVLPYKIYEKLRIYCQLVNDEISGMGTVEKLGPQKYKITEIFLIEQKVSKAQCEIKFDAVCNLMAEMIKQDKNPSMLRFWWHSHNSMTANFSHQDEKMGMQFAGTEYLISLVINHKGEMQSKMNIYNPIELVIDNINIEIDMENNNEAVIKECEKEIGKKVKKESCVITRTNLNSSVDIIEDQTDFNNYGFGYGFRGDLHENNNQNNIEKIRQDEMRIYGPYGDEFVECGVRFIWNLEEQKYKTYDAVTNMSLTDTEVQQRGIYQDYNKPSLTQDTPPEESEQVLKDPLN